MLKTILLLLFTLIGLPLIVYWFGDPFMPEQANMLLNMFWLMLCIAMLCFIGGELTRNNSQTDKIWSIAPIVYTWYFAWASNWDARITLMAVLVAIWGIRLTFNFWRRGGYHWLPWKGEEDYRWKVLRNQSLLQGKQRWTLFNLFFISFYQNALILLITFPAVACWAEAGKPLGAWDYVLAALLIAFIVVETIADQQQYNFQTAKYRELTAGKPLHSGLKEGFCQTGLWSVLRHPNYAAEQGIWLVFYGFSIVATGSFINWSLVGALLLLLLFHGSSDFSEKISSEKYPSYAAYKKRVGRFLPKLF
jgi:steroid 5-alpha reductase family enzyme